MPPHLRSRGNRSSLTCNCHVSRGVLPCFLGDRLKGVKRVMGIPVAAPVDIWIVTHAALRQNPVVTALMRTLADGMRRDAAQLDPFTVSRKR